MSKKDRGRQGSKEGGELPLAPVSDTVHKTCGWGKDRERQICGSLQRAPSTSYQVSRANKPCQCETLNQPAGRDRDFQTF